MLSADAAFSPANITGRRLQQEQHLCNGRVHTSYLQTTLLDAELYFDHFDRAASPGLWDQKPLLGEPRFGAVRFRCANDELDRLRTAYSGLALEPLVRAIRPHNGRRPFAPAAAGVALVVLVDYPNLFHQFGSFVIAWAAYQESYRLVPPPSVAGGANASKRAAAASSEEPLTIYTLNNATLRPTALFWAPGLAAHGRTPTFVRADPPPPPATYGRVVLVQPATETWWWTVWQAENTDRRATLRPLIAQLAGRLLPPGLPETARAHFDAEAIVKGGGEGGGKGGGGGGALAGLLVPLGLALVVRRPAGTDRRILNDDELARALSLALADRPKDKVPPLPGSPMTVRVVDLGALSTRSQLALIRRSALLVGAHGAGLLWNLFLPEGAALIELLNLANANQYYANHCRWARRRYGKWQNTDAAREERALDPLTREPVDPFRNHMRVKVDEVVQVAVGVLNEPNQDVVA